jgi:hypothetical protein
MSDEEKQEQPSVRKALYQHGQKITKHARHKVQSPVVNDEEYMPRDVMAACFFLHMNTVADIAGQVADADLSDEAEQEITEILDDVRDQFKDLDEVTHE